MNDRIRMLQVRAWTGIALTIAVMWGSIFLALAGWRVAAWCVDPIVLGLVGFAGRTVLFLQRARAQEARELGRRAEEKERRERLRQELRTLAAPDAVDGQCPVCGFDDLDQLAAVDAALEEPGSRFQRVVPYGPRRAHQECAELAPYKMTPAEEHELNHHGAAIARMIGCPLCAQETREQIANDPDVGRPIWPPLGITHAELSQHLTNLFSVPPADVGPMRGPLILPPPATYTPLKDTRPTQSVSGLAEGLLSADDVRRLGLRLPQLPDEKGKSR